MKHVPAKLKEAGEKLGFPVPHFLASFIKKLAQEEVRFGEETWLFHTVNDRAEDASDNFIIIHSSDLKEEWGHEGIVFASNGIGDYLLILRDPAKNAWLDPVFVLLHETAEIKEFAPGWQHLLQNGPSPYLFHDKCFIRSDDDGNIITPNENENEAETDPYYVAMDRRMHLDDLIDEQRTDLTSEIMEGLMELAGGEATRHKAWALNKLSDLYFKGFGPLPVNLEKALEYNGLAIGLESDLAYANRAACFLFGMGLKKDLKEAMRYAKRANELSRNNSFAELFATKDGGGMYDDLIELIKKEIKKAGR